MACNNNTVAANGPDMLMIQAVPVGGAIRFVREWGVVDFGGQEVFAPKVHTDIPLSEISMDNNPSNPFEVTHSIPEDVVWVTTNFVEDDVCFLASEFPGPPGQ
jgi:hypothetical protein